MGKRIEKWKIHNIITLIIGATIATSLNLLNTGIENSDLIFVFICGIVGISGMMLPGLSGSFILILMGNYELLMVKAISEVNIATNMHNNKVLDVIFIIKDDVTYSLSG